jgi:arylsulfatase A-like enzyme
MALNIDLAPTLLDMVGVPAPEAMQGRSLKPVLRGTGAPGRESWLYEHFPVYPIPIPGITAVRTGRYKYIEYQNDRRPRELFDLVADPKEKQNLYKTARGKKLLPGLEKELARLKRDTGYRFHQHG